MPSPLVSVLLAVGAVELNKQSRGSFIKHRGGCHCGEVKFEVEAPEEIEAHDCNCSICSKSGFLHLIVPKSRFILLQVQNRFQPTHSIPAWPSICFAKGAGSNPSIFLDPIPMVTASMCAAWSRLRFEKLL